jgi:hypothetical protein
MLCLSTAPQIMDNNNHNHQLTFPPDKAFSSFPHAFLYPYSLFSYSLPYVFLHLVSSTHLLSPNGYLFNPLSPCRNPVSILIFLVVFLLSDTVYYLISDSFCTFLNMGGKNGKEKIMLDHGRDVQQVQQ